MKTAKILRDKHEGDVPKTIEELCELPGVGEKMGFLTLHFAWGLWVLPTTLFMSKTYSQV
jgi:endonuclease III